MFMSWNDDNNNIYLFSKCWSSFFSKKKKYKIIFQQTKHTFYYMNIVSIQHLTLEAAVTSKEAYEAPVFLNIFPWAWHIQKFGFCPIIVCRFAQPIICYCGVLPFKNLQIVLRPLQCWCLLSEVNSWDIWFKDWDPTRLSLFKNFCNVGSIYSSLAFCNWKAYH